MIFGAMKGVSGVSNSHRGSEDKGCEDNVFFHDDVFFNGW